MTSYKLVLQPQKPKMVVHMRTYKKKSLAHHYNVKSKEF